MLFDKKGNPIDYQTGKARKNVIGKPKLRHVDIKISEDETNDYILKLNKDKVISEICKLLGLSKEEYNVIKKLYSDYSLAQVLSLNDLESICNIFDLVCTDHIGVDPAINHNSFLYNQCMNLSYLIKSSASISNNDVIYEQVMYDEIFNGWMKNSKNLWLLEYSEDDYREMFYSQNSCLCFYKKLAKYYISKMEEIINKSYSNPMNDESNINQPKVKIIGAKPKERK